MIELLTYDLKVAVLIAVFYMFYRLLLAQETFHRVNRIVLLLTAVASFVLPLCVITFHETVVMENHGTVGFDGLTLGVVDEEPAVPLWQTVLPILYIIGVITVLVRMLLAISRVLLLIRRSELHPQADGSVIAVTNKQLPPFSFFSTIVLSQKDYEEQNSAILTHERGHIRQRHSFDVVLVDVLTALQWFNPAMWMLRQDLRQIHEYEADAAVLSQGINARQYQYLLVSKAAGIGGYSIANGISHSTLKNRIRMMQNNNSNRQSLLKLLAIIPIVGTALVLNAETVQDVVYTDTPQKQIVKKGRANQTVKMGNQTIVVEKESITAPEGESVEISGVVTSEEDGKPIVGAIVKVEGSTLGTVTDREGRYSIKAKKNDVIQFSYVGYETGKFLMPPDVKMLESSPAVLDIQLFKEGAASMDASGNAFDVVEQMPEFPGGPAKLFEYISTNIRYPKEAEEAGQEGRVIATFIVEKDGAISEPRVVKSVSPALDAEALRVVSAMPNWTPGYQSGKPVRVKYTVPLTFKLQGDKTPAVKPHGIDPATTDVEIDGKLVNVEQLGKIDPSTIDRIDVLKERPGEQKSKIIVTTKKK